jgi:hypothetical protein
MCATSSRPCAQSVSATAGRATTTRDDGGVYMATMMKSVYNKDEDKMPRLLFGCYFKHAPERCGFYQMPIQGVARRTKANEASNQEAAAQAEAQGNALLFAVALDCGRPPSVNCPQVAVLCVCVLVAVWTS